MKRLERLLSIASPLAVLVLWELLVKVNLLDARFFPAPTSVFASLRELTASGELWQHIGISLERIAKGFVIGAVPGAVLGIAMGLNRWVRAIAGPVVWALYPIPKTAILPLIMLVLGLGEASKIALVAISVFFVVLINAMAGVRQIDPIYLDVGKNFGVGRWQFFRTIALPGALPVIMAGVKLGMGISLIVIVVAEMVGSSTSGIGYLIWLSWTTLEVEQMYAGLIVISALGILTSLALDELERFVVPWKKAQ